MNEYVEKTSPMTFPKISSPINVWDMLSDEVLGESPSDEHSSEKTSPMNIVEKGPPMNFADKPSDESPSDDYSGGPSAARVREAQTRLLELTACTCGWTPAAERGHDYTCVAGYREDVVVLVAVAELGRTVARGSCATTRNA